MNLRRENMEITETPKKKDDEYEHFERIYNDSWYDISVLKKENDIFLFCADANIDKNKNENQNNSNKNKANTNISGTSGTNITENRINANKNCTFIKGVDKNSSLVHTEPNTIKALEDLCLNKLQKKYNCTTTNIILNYNNTYSSGKKGKNSPTTLGKDNNIRKTSNVKLGVNTSKRVSNNREINVNFNSYALARIREKKNDFKKKTPKKKNPKNNTQGTDKKMDTSKLCKHIDFFDKEKKKLTEDCVKRSPSFEGAFENSIKCEGSIDKNSNEKDATDNDKDADNDKGTNGDKDNVNDKIRQGDDALGANLIPINDKREDSIRISKVYVTDNVKLHAESHYQLHTDDDHNDDDTHTHTHTHDIYTETIKKQKEHFLFNKSKCNSAKKEHILKDEDITYAHITENENQKKKRCGSFGSVKRSYILRNISLGDDVIEQNSRNTDKETTPCERELFNSDSFHFISNSSKSLDNNYKNKSVLDRTDIHVIANNNNNTVITATTSNNDNNNNNNTKDGSIYYKSNIFNDICIEDISNLSASKGFRGISMKESEMMFSIDFKIYKPLLIKCITQIQIYNGENKLLKTVFIDSYPQQFSLSLVNKCKINSESSFLKIKNKLLHTRDTHILKFRFLCSDREVGSSVITVRSLLCLGQDSGLFISIDDIKTTGTSRFDRAVHIAGEKKGNRKDKNKDKNNDKDKGKEDRVKKNKHKGIKDGNGETTPLYTVSSTPISTVVPGATYGALSLSNMFPFNQEDINMFSPKMFMHYKLNCPKFLFDTIPQHDIIKTKDKITCLEHAIRDLYIFFENSSLFKNMRVSKRNFTKEKKKNEQLIEPNESLYMNKQKKEYSTKIKGSTNKEPTKKNYTNGKTQFNRNAKDKTQQIKYNDTQNNKQTHTSYEIQQQECQEEIKQKIEKETTQEGKDDYNIQEEVDGETTQKESQKKQEQEQKQKLEQQLEQKLEQKETHTDIDAEEVSVNDLIFSNELKETKKEVFCQIDTHEFSEEIKRKEENDKEEIVDDKEEIANGKEKDVNTKVKEDIEKKKEIKKKIVNEEKKDINEKEEEIEKIEEIKENEEIETEKEKDYESQDSKREVCLNEKETMDKKSVEQKTTEGNTSVLIDLEQINGKFSDTDEMKKTVEELNKIILNCQLEMEKKKKKIENLKQSYNSLYQLYKMKSKSFESSFNNSLKTDYSLINSEQQKAQGQQSEESEDLCNSNKIRGKGVYKCFHKEKPFTCRRVTYKVSSKKIKLVDKKNTKNSRRTELKFTPLNKNSGNKKSEELNTEDKSHEPQKEKKDYPTSKKLRTQNNSSNSSNNNNNYNNNNNGNLNAYKVKREELKKKNLIKKSKKGGELDRNSYYVAKDTIEECDKKIIKAAEAERPQGESNVLKTEIKELQTNNHEYFSATSLLKKKNATNETEQKKIDENEHLMIEKKWETAETVADPAKNCSAKKNCTIINVKKKMSYEKNNRFDLPCSFIKKKLVL